MAEAFGIAAGSLTVLELTAKVVKQCKTLMETAHDAPRDLRHIFVEISSLKAVLESFEFLSRAEFSDTAQSLADANGIVEGCRSTVDELSKELDGLSLANSPQVAPGKRQRIKGSLQWCLKESKTRKLLDETMQHKTTITLALLGEITSDVKQIKSTVERVDDRLTDTDRRNICNWIEHTNPTAIHHQACKNHEEHTCQWIHRADQWSDWLHLQRRLVWIHGIPGAGKTVLASYLIQQTIAYCESLNTGRATCLYYYCSFRHGQGERRDEALPFLRWIVSQLCRRSDQIPSNLVALYRNNNTPSFRALKEALKNLLVRFDVLYIVVDAVDESSPRDDLLELIHDIVTQPNYGKIQLLATSRRYPDIEGVLRPLSEPTLPMSNSIVDADIRTYADAIIQRNKHFARWPEQLRKEILESLVQGAQGMFRWVVCHIDRLQRKSPQQATEAIKCLPRTLEETYETIFLEIPEEDWYTARTALQWISGHSQLQFSYGIPANCLTSAVLGPGRTSVLDLSGDGHEHGFLESILGCLIEVGLTYPKQHREEGVSVLGGSVDGDPDKACFHTVTLAHYTIEEYLFSNRVKGSKVYYFEMSRDACAQKILETVLQPKTEADQSSSDPHVFKVYCNSIARTVPSCWGSLLVRDATFWHQYYDFFHKHRNSWKCLCHDYNGFFGKREGQFDYGPTDDPTTVKTQYLIAILEIGCIDMVKKLLGELSLEATLSVSVPLWLDRNCDPNSSMGKLDSATILEVLGAYSCEMMTKPYYCLLECLRSRMDPSKLFLFHLQAHYHEGSCDRSCVIDDLLDMGANANPPCGLVTPLQIAVRNWDHAGVEILLEHGADPNGVGQPDGYIPAHIDTTWARSSPLHILRNAEWGLRPVYFYIHWKEGRARDRSKIEALLLEYGAEDFVRSEPAEDRPKKLEVRYLLGASWFSKAVWGSSGLIL